MDTNERRETNHSAPILQKRHRVYAWRGAGIGVFLGILAVGTIILSVVRSSNPLVAGEQRTYWLMSLGAPVDMLLAGIGLVLRRFTTVLEVMNPLSQLAAIGLSPFLCLSIPLNWGMIGWLVGNGRKSFQANSAAFLKRRRVYAWKGAGIGTCVGILIEGSMILLTVKSSNPDGMEKMLLSLPFVGVPVFGILNILAELLTIGSNKIGLPSQWIGILGSMSILLSIPLSWGMFGFGIGWLVGDFRNSPQTQMPLQADQSTI